MASRRRQRGRINAPGAAPVKKAAVGKNISRTQAGIHPDGLLKNPDRYLPFLPEMIGARPVELVLGSDSGSSAVRHHLQARGIQHTDEHTQLVPAYLKSEHRNPEDFPTIRDTIAQLAPHISSLDASNEPALDDCSS